MADFLIHAFSREAALKNARRSLKRRPGCLIVSKIKLDRKPFQADAKKRWKIFTRKAKRCKR